MSDVNSEIKTMSKLPDDDPTVLAWEAFKKTSEYKNAERWAGKGASATEGSLWVAFVAGLVTQQRKDADLMAQNARWKKAVEGLTPGGSEFVDDPERCAEYIRERCQWPRQIVELRKAVRDAYEMLEPLTKPMPIDWHFGPQFLRRVDTWLLEHSALKEKP